MLPSTVWSYTSIETLSLSAFINIEEKLEHTKEKKHEEKLEHKNIWKETPPIYEY